MRELELTAVYVLVQYVFDDIHRRTVPVVTQPAVPPGRRALSACAFFLGYGSELRQLAGGGFGLGASSRVRTGGRSFRGPGSVEFWGAAGRSEGRDWRPGKGGERSAGLAQGAGRKYSASQGRLPEVPIPPRCQTAARGAQGVRRHPAREDRERAGANRALRGPARAPEQEIGVAPSASVLGSGLEPTHAERQERSAGAQLATVRARESDHRSLAGSESSDSGSDEERMRRALASEPRMPATRLEWVEAPPGFECLSKGVLVVYGTEQQTPSSVEGSKLSVQALAWHPKVQSAPPAGSETAKPDLERRVKAFLGRQRQSQLAAILGEWNAAAVLAAQRRERGTLAASRREALLLTHAWSDWAENAKQFVRLRYFHAGVRQRQVRALFSAWQRLRESVRERRVRWGEVQWVLDHRKERLMRSSWSTWQNRLKASKGLRYLGQDQEVTGVVWFQRDTYGLSASGSYQLELYQQSLAETKKVLRQKRNDPFNSSERTNLRAFVVNINRPGQLVGRGVSLRDVRKAVQVAVQKSAEDYRESRRRSLENPPITPTDKRWANQFALLSSPDEELVGFSVESRKVPKMAQVATRRKPTGSRRRPSEDPSSSESIPRATDRAPKAPRSGSSMEVPTEALIRATRKKKKRAPRRPSASPDASSSSSYSSSSKNSARTSESSLDSALSSRDRKELQELREELRKESRGRAAAADALAERMAQQLRESQRVSDERRAAEQAAADERQAQLTRQLQESQKVAEERQAQLTRQLQESQKVAEERQTQLSLQLRESQKALEERLASEALAVEESRVAIQRAADERIAHQLAEEEQRAVDQQAADARKQEESRQLEERLQAAVAAQVQKLVLAQASPSGPVESGASVPGPGAETPSSGPHHGLVETASATTCDVRGLSTPTPDVKVQQPHAWDMVSLPVRACQAIRDRVVEHGSGGVDAQFLFYKVAREYREAGQADEHGLAAYRIRNVARAKVRTGERVLVSQVVLGFSESWGSEIPGGECSR
ncbi:hypothetical protein CYMTET_22960, partial [Cymbomonas tetramitiformis]